MILWGFSKSFDILALIFNTAQTFLGQNTITVNNGTVLIITYFLS